MARRRLKKKIKYDFVIYSCLVVAAILIVQSFNDYLSETSYSLKELITGPEEEIIIIKEPDNLKSVDKSIIVNKYFINILDEITEDDLVKKEHIRSWNKYEIQEFNYIREIAKDYHSYSVNIKIPNQSAKLPTVANINLSTNEYLVLTLVVNISKDQDTGEYLVKSIDRPRNT